MDYRQLRYALSVYKERSFTKAARRLNISQSAVSEQVKLLEEEIGFELFSRTSGGIESTERGRTFLYESERVMGDLLSLSDTARRLRGSLSDTLTIGMGSGMAQIFIPRIFADLKSALPGVRLDILTAPTKNIFNELHEERIDAGIGLGGAVDSGRTDRQRPRRGLVMQRSPRHAAIQRQSRRQLKTDQMVSGRRAEMRAVLEPHAEHRDPAFARRAARCNRDRRTAIILGQVNFTEFHHADVVSSGILVRNNARKTLVLASWSVNLFS